MKMQDDNYKYKRPGYIVWLFGIACALVGSSELISWYNNGFFNVDKYKVVLSGNHAFVSGVVMLVFGLVVVGYCVYSCKFRK